MRPKQQMPAAGARDMRAGERQVRLPVPVLRLSVLQIDIDHDELEPGRHADQRVGLARATIGRSHRGRCWHP